MASLPFREGTPAPRMATEDEQMVALNQKLKALGIEQTIRLPQICVIGDQSTGKSSLIEALSMVNVPRDTGCCTRCPLEVNLIKADDAQPWSCNVSLLKRYEFRRASTAKGAKSRTTDSWEELAQPDSTRFAQTDIKEDVCNLIRRAQAATLSPGIDAATFISGPVKREYLVNFSPNAVHLDIVQHELPSLSFVDLPGIVTRQDEGRHLVELVDALSTKYANNERSINLLTLSMMADFDTSKALSIILELKAESRTLAVMTKADLIRKEDPIDDFLKLLKGTAGPKMKYGYHAVMMDPDSSLSHAAAIQREGNFFDEDKRWAGLAISDQKKLGTVKLSETLSVLLEEATRHTLPSSLQLIEDRLEVVQKKLQQLPAPPGLEQMSIALTALINEFGDKMIKLFEGGGNADEFLLKSRWDRLAEAFRVTLLNSRPKLQLGTKMESAQKLKAERSLSESVELSDEDTQSPAPKSERKVTGPRAKSISTFHSFQLEEIRETNQRHGTTGLGPQMFPGARQAMMKKSLHRLDSMSQDFLEATFKLIKEHVSKHSKNVFRGYEGMALLPAATEHINAFVEACCNEQHDRSMALCKTEKTKPYTLDSATSAKEARRYLHILQTARADFRLKLEKAVHDAAHAGKVRKGPEFKKKVDDLADDEWDTEIELLAHVRAYHQIAASRYADNVCQDVYACTFPKLAYEMAESLAEFLGPMRPEQHDKMVAWMSEDPGRELERNRLVKERESLLEARMLVQAALAKDAKGGKRKDRGEADVEMGGTPTESEEGGDESPLKKTKYREGLQASVEDEMDEE